MITKLHINNYKLFKTIEFNELSRINIFTGDNNSGKSTILEAIALACGQSLGSTFRIPLGVNLPKRSFHQDLSLLFYDLNLNAIRFDLIRDDKKLQTIIEQNYETNLLSQIPKPNEADSVLERFCRYKINLDGQEFGTDIYLAKNKDNNSYLMPSNDNLRRVPFVGYFDTTRLPSSDLLPEVTILGKKSRLVNIIRNFDSRVLELEFVNDEIYVRVDSLRDELIPLRYLGHGIKNLIAIFCCVILSANTTQLIDEIDVGIYYKKFPLLIQTLDELCTEFNVQLFIATHSSDFIKSLYHFSDYNLFRLSNKFKGGYSRRTKEQSDSVIQDDNVDIR